jgi:glycosyltransferase involved in cell wall biosynthesis
VKGLTAIVITRDEAMRIRPCLDSIAWVDEIMVLDAESTDETVAICREYTDRVYVRPWPGYAAQKNYGIEQASGAWILSLDADERCSPGLQTEIQGLLATEPDCDGYYIPFRNYLGTRWLRYAGLYPDYHLRLFRKNSGRFVGTVHETVRVDGKVGHLRNDVLHYTYRDLSDYLSKVDRYTTLEAQDRLARGLRARWRDFLRPPAVFLWLFIGKQGWRSPASGLIVSAFQAFYVFLRYAKLWEMQHAER